jgi:hypothetical protein
MCSPTDAGAEELHEELQSIPRIDLVLDAWWDGLHVTCTENHIDHRIGLRTEPEFSLFDEEPSPLAARDAVCPPKTGWQGVFVPSRSGAEYFETFWQLRAIAQRAVEGRPHALGSCLLVQHPRCRTEGRGVADVLAVEALEKGDPVAGVVLFERSDRTLHASETRLDLEGNADQDARGTGSEQRSRNAADECSVR